MSYFSPVEASLPIVEEIAPHGNRLRVVIRAGNERYVLHDVVDCRFAVGDEVPEWRRDFRFRSWSPLAKWDPWNGVDDD